MLHYDNFTIERAMRFQDEMKSQISLKTLNKNLTTIGGADISHAVGSSKLFAGIVILSYPDLIPLSYSLVEGDSKFEYKSEFLAFREVPTLLKAWEQIPIKPDLLILDGHGITHPRRMGIASHFGLLANHPTIGCAKNMLHGDYSVLDYDKFSISPIVKNGEKLGYALRTKNGVKPVFISPGHHMSVDDCIEIMKNTIQRYRIPEPTRHAHQIVNLFRTGQREAGYHVLDSQLPLF